jgi:hypothetical protein
MGLSQNYTYTANGTEGTTLTTPLTGQKILFLFKGDKILVPTTGVPGVNEYSFNNTNGQFIFGTNLENLQVLQAIYRPQ